MSLSQDETGRYARHIVLKDIGGAGQQKIKAARVLVVGAGGLGLPVIAGLAGTGVGAITIVDPDTVSLSNLQRQFAFRTDDLGTPKVEAARRFALDLNPHVNVVARPWAFDAETGRELVDDQDIVVDGTDDFATKKLIGDVCETARVPLVTGALGPFDGSLTVLTPYDGVSPRFGDLFPHAPHPNDSPPCEIAGVLSVLPSIVGSMMANEALKLIAGYGNPLVGRALLYSARTGEITALKYGRGAP